MYDEDVSWVILIVVGGVILMAGGIVLLSILGV